jgi:serine/threonine-protein kinase
VTDAELVELSEGTTLLGRYTIIDRIAGGGMATIYRATDERLDRVVCVKLLRLVVEASGSTSGGAVYQATYAHFHKEALALSKLQHPNTLRIYDFGYLDGEESPRPFQISEFMDGGNLEQHVRARGALKPEHAIAILERVCGAVAEAHQHQIIHRDIKPSNILFARIGEELVPKLADFGIARTDLRKRLPPGMSDDEAETEVISTVPLFSPRWAAPEQLAAAEEGPTTDVYALGLVAAFMLSGKSVFDIEDVRSTFADRVLGDTLVSKRLVAMGLGKDVRDVLVAAMRAKPGDRIASAMSFYEALSRAVGGARTQLPAPAPSDGRQPLASVTLEAIDRSERSTSSFAPPERAVDVNGALVRIVEVHEKLDVTAVNLASIDVRFRVTLLPGKPLRVQFKGLNCFVARSGGTPSPAITTETDGRAELVSMTRSGLVQIAWSFGRLVEGGRALPVGAAELILASPAGASALALDIGGQIIAVCRRAHG